MTTLTKQDLDYYDFAADGITFVGGNTCTYKVVRDAAEVEIFFTSADRVNLNIETQFFSAKGLKELRKLLKTMIQDMEAQQAVDDI